MVEMALSKLSEGNVVNLDEERKAAHGEQPAGSAVRKQGCTAHSEQRVHILTFQRLDELWTVKIKKRIRSKYFSDFRPLFGKSLPLGQKTISGR